MACGSACSAKGEPSKGNKMRWYITLASFECLCQSSIFDLITRQFVCPFLPGRNLPGVQSGVLFASNLAQPVHLTNRDDKHQPGVFAVDQSWPETGAWVLAISTSERVHMLIEMGDGGGVTRTSYYGKPAADLALRSVRIVTGQLPDEKINQALTALPTAR